jgi:cell division protein FtsL
MNKALDKKGVDFSFSWIFAIIAGAAILVFAVYSASQLIKSGKVQTDTIVAGEIDSLLNTVSTNIEDSKHSVIDFSQDSRIYNDCSIEGAFGVQKLSTSSKSGNKWSDQSIKKSSFNKYIFSRKIEETKNKKINVLTSQFIEPFKIGDATIIYGQNYCFVNPSSNIESLFLDLSSDGSKDIGINISSSVESCPSNFTKVCFDRIGCDVNVNTQSEVVSKSGKDLYFHGDALELSAIFSDPEIYECQLKRFMKRANELAVVYSKKALYIENYGCNNNLVNDLQSFILSTNISNSRDFVRQVLPISQEIARRNDALASCKVF